MPRRETSRDVTPSSRRLWICEEGADDLIVGASRPVSRLRRSDRLLLLRISKASSNWGLRPGTFPCGAYQPHDPGLDRSIDPRHHPSQKLLMGSLPLGISCCEPAGHGSRRPNAHAQAPKPPRVWPTGNDLSGYRNCPMRILVDSCAGAHPQNGATGVENRADRAWDRLGRFAPRRLPIGSEDQGDGFHAGVESELGQEALHVAPDGGAADL